jgi:hypothetical protein
VRDAAEEADAILDALAARERTQALLLRPQAGDQQVIAGELRDGADHQVVRLARNEMSDRQQGRRSQAEPAPRLGAIDRPEGLQVDAVAQHTDLGGLGAELDQAVLQRGADCNHAGGLARRPADHPSRPGVFGNQVDVGAAGRDRHRPAESAAEHHRGDAVRIEVVRVDQIEIEAVAPQLRDRRARRGIEAERCRQHADLRDQRIAGMAHGQAVPYFLQRRLVALRIVRHEPAHEREHRHGCDDLDLGGAAGGEMADPVLHEHAMRGLSRIRIQRRERQDAQGTRADVRRRI